MSYVFYDTETTGTETPFDQILQFAAVRTDDTLNVEERFNIRCRLQPHIIPSPKALLITRVTPAMLTDPDLPSHYTMIRQIRDLLLTWSPATFIGFNSLSFDEDLLRQAFFQTLHPPYLTNTNGNARSDVLRIAYATNVYAPGAMVVATDRRGRRVFRLDSLASVNGYVGDDAHEAMADVEATISLARVIRDRAPDIWNVMERATTRNAVVANLRTDTQFTLTESYYGRTYSWLVSPCGQNPNDAGQFSMFDLAFDPDDYRHLSAEDLVAVLNASPKVIRSLRANRQPIIMPADAAPDGTAALRISVGERRRRAESIQDDRDFRARVGQALALRYADRARPAYVEQRIYDGFPSAADQTLMEQFHRADWRQRFMLAEEIDDPRISEFARRLIYFEHPEMLPAAHYTELGGWMAERVLAERASVPWMTINKALREVDALLQGANAEDTSFLEAVNGFLCDRAEQVAAGG